MPIPEWTIVKIVTYAAIFGLVGLGLGVKFRKNIGGALIGYSASQILALLLLVKFMGG